MSETYGTWQHGEEDTETDAAPALQPADTTTGGSLLDELLAEGKKEIGELVAFPVSTRPGWIFQFRALFSAKDIDRFRKAGTNGKRNRQPDAIMANALPLLEASTGIFRGEVSASTQVPDPEGGEMKLTSTAFLEANGHPDDAIKALQAFMGDAALVTMATALLEAAGWTEELTPVDPTNG